MRLADVAQQKLFGMHGVGYGLRSEGEVRALFAKACPDLGCMPGHRSHQAAKGVLYRLLNFKGTSAAPIDIRIGAFGFSKLSLISSIIAKLKGKDSLVSEASFTEKLMMAKLLYATESFVDFGAQELGQFVPRQFETQLAKKALLLSYILRKAPAAADGSKS